MRMKNKKTGEIKEPLELHKYKIQKISNRSHFSIGPDCQPWLVQANFLLVA